MSRRCNEHIGIDADTFRRLAAVYRKRWGVELSAARTDGTLVLRGRGKFDAAPEADSVRRLAISEALRWGEPEVQSGPGAHLTWAAPLLHNARLLGGLVASVSERWLFPRGGLEHPRIDIRAACANLRRLAEEHNLTNAALLEARRSVSQRERERAEAIHAFKAQATYDMKAAYLLDEPMLLGAIRQGDRGRARAILNKLLVGMIHRAGERLDLAKSFFMELVVALSRSAVEAGGAPEELLGANFASISDLSRIDSDEDLAAWLHQVLERIMDSIHRHRHQSHPAMLGKALRYMGEHCCRDVSRNEVAQAAYLSPSHFSRLFHKHLGQSFTTVLNQMRIERASEWLTRTDKDLKIIALEAGFTDQSYFTKVFRKVRGVTPAEFRRRGMTNEPNQNDQGMTKRQ